MGFFDRKNNENIVRRLREVRPDLKASVVDSDYQQGGHATRIEVGPTEYLDVTMLNGSWAAVRVFRDGDGVRPVSDRYISRLPLSVGASYPAVVSALESRLPAVQVVAKPTTPPPPAASPARLSTEEAISRLQIRALNDMLNGAMDSTEDAARWIIGELQSEAERLGAPLSEFDLWVLSSSPDQFTAEQHAAVVATHNKCVQLVRSCVELAKQAGLPKVKVRRGLVLPESWEDRYSRIYGENLPWFVSAVMQNAFMGNPLANESKPWVSK